MYRYESSKKLIEVVQANLHVVVAPGNMRLSGFCVRNQYTIQNCSASQELQREVFLS